MIAKPFDGRFNEQTRDAKSSAGILYDHVMNE